MDIKKLQHDAFANGVAKGWYGDVPNPAELPKYLMYVTTELAEIMEDWREGKPINEWMPDQNGKPQGIPSEFADILIWCGSLAGYYGFDLEAAVKAKMAYNTTRPKLHGAVRH